MIQQIDTVMNEQKKQRELLRLLYHDECIYEWWHKKNRLLHSAAYAYKIDNNSRSEST